MNHIERLIQIVEDYYQLKPGELITKDRSQPLVHRRFLAMYVLRRYRNDGPSRIAIEFICDHSTVIHGVREFENILDTNHSNYRMELREILDLYQSDICNVDLSGITPENEIKMYQTLATL
jgi:chromosomal replication initiation ATPase DnaA